MRILLLSAYNTLSHRYWHENLVAQFPEYEWTVLTLPPRYFNFRVRSNPVSWWLTCYEELRENFQLIIATSLVDISTLRGLFPNLANTPLWLYCHENQFAYPVSQDQRDRHEIQRDIDVKMVFLYACFCADLISFNSHWNRNTAMAGLKELLTAFPEKLDKNLIDLFKKKSDVLPVPLVPQPKCQSEQSAIHSGSDSLHIIWNHRWEYDKGPEYLLAFVNKLKQKNIACTLHVVGQQFRQQPEAFRSIAAVTRDKETCPVVIGSWGYVESKKSYQQLLNRCDIVLSTALHDFQGIAILEAVQAGCVPLLPNTLAYPELFDERYLYVWNNDPVQCANAMVGKLQAWLEVQIPIAPRLEMLQWPAMREAYRQLIEQLVV